jgi:hypothetical protein
MPKKHFSFSQSYVPLATYGGAIIVLGADTVCTLVPYKVVTWVQPVLYPGLGVEEP